MSQIIFLPLSLVCAGAILYRYYRIGKWPAGLGWALIILTIGGFGSGLAESFAWSGLAFLFVGGCGLILLLQELSFRRKSGRKHRRSGGVNFEREN